MPKKPKFIHPVRALRELISEAKGNSISQPAFAKMVGTSPATIQSIELGRLKISSSLASKIAFQFGADVESLMTNSGKPMRDNRPLTVGDLSFSAELEEQGLLAATDYALMVDILKAAQALLLASRSPNKKRFRAVAAGLTDWVLTSAAEYNLKKEYKTVKSSLDKEISAFYSQATTANAQRAKLFQLPLIPLEKPNS
jgi:DNA-binding XRE family transcriptional regulator